MNGRPVSFSVLDSMLANPVYRGRIEAWGISAEGDFEPLVDEATFARVQARLARRSGAARRRWSAAFPLRGFIRCGACDHPYFAKGAKAASATTNAAAAAACA